MGRTWTQVKSDFDPKRFTHPHGPCVFGKDDRLGDYCDGQRPLEQAIKRLGKQKSAA